MRYVLPSLLAVISQSGFASATRLFVCLGVYAIHQEYYKKMLETARQTMMSFGENILEIDEEEEEEMEGIVAAGAQRRGGNAGDMGRGRRLGGAEDGTDDGARAGAAARGDGRQPGNDRRPGRGPLRVVAYLVKRWLRGPAVHND